MTAEHAHGHDHVESHHEESDVNIRAILGFGAGLIAVAVVVHIAVWLLFLFFASREAKSQPQPEFPLAVTQQDRLPPAPRLQTSPRQDLKDLRAEEDVVLGSYGWVNRNAGIVRIPIDEAMKLALERGLPARAGRPPAAASATGESNSGRMIGNIDIRK